jgi:hypothetical protein
VDDTVGEASKLLAGRKGTKGGHPTDPELKSYTALFLYRMGHFPEDIATQIGLNKKVNVNWKSKLKKAIERGIEIEQEKFSSAAEVFARRDEKKVREAALAAYANYHDHYPRGPENGSAELEDGDDLLGMPANETEQMQKAMIQLGSCIKRGLGPVVI